MKEVNETWRVTLVPFSLAGDKKTTIARLNSTDIEYDIERIVGELTEGSSVIDKYAYAAFAHRLIERCQYLLLAGHTIQLDNLVKMWAKIEGDWSGRQVFTKGHHKRTVGVTIPRSFARDLEKVHVEVVEHLPTNYNAVVFYVVDLAEPNKLNLITINDNIRIKGDRIKIVGLKGSDELKEGGIGVFFTDPKGRTTQATRMDKNTATELEVRVPATLLPDTEYAIKIVTRYAGSNILNEPRTIEVPFYVKTRPHS